MISNNIVSERLIIRDVSENDAKDIWKIWSNSDNEEYMSDPVESEEEVRRICKNSKDGEGYLTVATLKDTGEIIGTCCFGHTNKNDQWGFGYSIRKEYWGKGYATEIVKSVIEFGYSLGIKDFTSDCAIENTGSGRVMEKCGMHIDHTTTFKQPKSNIVYQSYVYKLHMN